MKKKHVLLMLLCCAIPLGLLFFLSLTGKAGSWGFYALFLLCPLMHVFLMPHRKNEKTNEIKVSSQDNGRCH
jgi:hypothetical protein